MPSCVLNQTWDRRYNISAKEMAPLIAIDEDVALAEGPLALSAR